jgi:putative glutamine amidotransferase
MARPLIGIAPNYRLKQKRGDSYVLDANYVKLIRESGGQPVILPLVETLEEARETVGRLDGLLLSGGGDLDPARYGQNVRRTDQLGAPARNTSDLYLARAAQERGTPTLGVCLGIQVMNVEFGGTLLQHLPEDVPGSLKHEEEDGETLEHAVAVEPGSILARILGAASALVNSFHHQSIGKVAPGFRVAAKSPDGVIEAIERPDLPFYVGVQWHPERMLDSPVTRKLTGAFVDAGRGATVRAGS